ncbi:MAG: hypothetical protein J5586_01480 [Clostridia bacterium]|nr:hypothetical protein [Clostridia bacterium]
MKENTRLICHNGTLKIIVAFFTVLVLLAGFSFDIKAESEFSFNTDNGGSDFGAFVKKDLSTGTLSYYDVYHNGVKVDPEDDETTPSSHEQLFSDAYDPELE